ncbi:MAG: ATP-binding protein [Candidatus Staskawiczbacteria bacterium]|nr:ATP-binding protein [Candidatus Staskawiczbacteria bacterium]
MKLFERAIEKRLRASLFKGKIICLYGPRRSGKTTLVKKILAEFNDEGYYLNCEDARERNYLVVGRADILKNYIGNKKIVVLDEAQTVEYIGKILKLFVDTYPEIQIIATGSSSFDLANRIGEPLVGRAYEFLLYPLSVGELITAGNKQEVIKNSENLLRFGTYPSIIDVSSESEKPKLLEDLLKLLALQIGSEVSLNELAQKLEVARPTIERYLELLEKTYVIRRLYTLKRNVRNEILGGFKVLFYDLGVRNYLINNFNTMKMRNDSGALFENFFIMERIKYHHNINGYLPLVYFWRTYDQKEIDFIEEQNGMFKLFECKFHTTKINTKAFALFKTAYPESSYVNVTIDNFIEYLS